MKLLFLRGKVPTDRDPRQIMYNKIENNCDMWTQLAYHLSLNGYGEVWYWGGNRKVKYKNNFIEKWFPNFKKAKNTFEPDIIFARGGFPEYDLVLKRFPKAYKIYYGAGRRFYPKKECKFKNYNLILNDTPVQLEKTKQKFPNTRVELLLKPCAENVFYPVKREKKYDVIMVANEHTRGWKGHDFAFKYVPNNLSMVQIGIVSKKVKKGNRCISFTGWISRKKIKEYYGMSKVAIICCTKKDSAPRVIAEALACNCPILILDRVKFWSDKYITEQTGRICSEDNFAGNLIEMVNHYGNFSPYNYYRDNLSMEKSVGRIKKIVNKG